MIKLNTPSFIYTSEETQTSSKVSELVVIYSNILTYVDDLPVGVIQSYCMNDSVAILTDTQNADLFSGNILSELTNQYIAILQALNPSITFVNTL